MNQIWKTPLNLESDGHGDRITEIETMGLVLRVGIDPNGVPAVWYWAPDSNHRLKTKIVVLWTGEETPNWLGGYVGTFNHRALVWHAFEQAL